MRSSPRRVLLGILALTGIVALVPRIAAQLDSAAENVVGRTAEESALYRPMQVPGGAVLGRRAPEESIAALTALERRSPGDAALYALRAQERERLLELAGAEQDWRRAVELTADKRTALMGLADFYHRRLQPEKELSTLLRVAKIPAAGVDRFQSETWQMSWRAFERAAEVAKESRLGSQALDDLYESWIERYPDSSTPYTLYLDTLVAHRDLAHAQTLATRIAAQFPSNIELQIETEAKVLSISGGSGAELATYSRRFDPMWSANLRNRYFELLKASHQLHRFLADARNASNADPLDLAPVVRTYFYYEQSGDRESADRALLEWDTRVAAAAIPVTPEQYKLIAALFERVGDYDESARASYSLYELKAASPADREAALANLISLLLDVPEQPLRLGRRDLSLYRNIAQMDQHPGFLNGILSLALNTTSPEYEYQNASQTAVAYFHRAAASHFLERMKVEFPGAKSIPALEAKLFAAYAVYGQNDANIRVIPAWLEANKTSPDYVNSALLLADAYFATRRTADEFQLYNRLLDTLATRSDHVPIGPEAGQHLRSADYARVLDRYLSRLTQLHRLTEAIALYQRQILRNPDDPGLYERLALFIEQNRLDAQLEETYREALARFKDDSWAGKLARLYLRHKQYGSYETLLREVSDAFHGSELARFITEVAPNASVTPVLYRQINLYAHRRFPHNLTFVRNLLHAYQMKATADPLAYERLLRQNWFYDASLRTAYFEYLTRTGKLRAQLAALPEAEDATQQKNTAALAMRAEGFAWLTQFENGAEAFLRLGKLAPGDRISNARAIAIERSLSANDPDAFHRAIELAEQDVKAAPADSQALTRIGEIYAEHDLYREAAPWWNRVAMIRPGSADSYLAAATVFWDYFRYNDALRVISDARRSFHKPALFAYEAGAIYENENDFAHAVDEYIHAALEQPSSGENSQAEDRLLVLAGRKNTGTLVEQRSATLVAGSFNARAIELRIHILESSGRRGEIHELLRNRLTQAGTITEAEDIRQRAEHFGFDDITVAALDRTIALTTDPVDELKAGVGLALFYEAHGNVPQAERELHRLLNENPAVLGVIRSNVDFYWRQKQFAKAVSTLISAASRAQQPYATELRSEAAQKAAESGAYQTARALLDQLLASDPFNADLLARKAATFAHAQDIPGLAAFYEAELRSVETSPLPAETKVERASALRRGYIPALIKTGQFELALAQYEQLLNHFPEDESLTREAAVFAKQQALEKRLIAYYEKAIADSPRNYRWPLLLARLDRVLGNYEQALAAYDKAAYVRPDRADIFTAKADLELRLGRYDAALQTNDKLYELSFHASRYLVAKAAIEARRGNAQKAVQLLKAAFIEPQPKQLAGYIRAMQQLIAWHMFKETDQLYRELLPLLPEHPDDAGQAVALELQALASAHRVVDAFSVFQQAAVRVRVLLKDSSPQYSQVIGSAIHQYATPEEKAAIVARISQSGGLPTGLKVVELARAAGLYDIAANALARSPNQWMELAELQKPRLAFDSLGRTLEHLARQQNADEQRTNLLNAAAEAYQNADNTLAQTRVFMSLLADNSPVDAPRFSEAFLAAHGDLQSLAAKYPLYADAVAQRLIRQGTFEQVKSALANRGRPLAPPWIDAYTGLCALYFAEYNSAAAGAFDRVLGARTVGAELTDLQAPNSVALRGAKWLYYGGRYGEFLARNNSGEAWDLLPAPLESAPAASNSYVELGDSLREMKKIESALREYRAAIELSPTRADVYDRIAQAQFGMGDKPEARTNWAAALHLLTSAAETAPLAPEFVATARDVISHLSYARVSNELAPDVDRLIVTVARRRGVYNAMPLVGALLKRAPNYQQRLSEMIELAPEVDFWPILSGIVSGTWIPEEQKGPVYRLAIDLAEQKLTRSAGDAASAARDQMQQARINYSAYLLSQNRGQDAWGLLSDVDANRRPADLVLKAAALSGHIQEQLAAWRDDAAQAPDPDQALSVASELSHSGHADAALAIREFEYQRELQHPNPPASAYFGLAEARLEQSRAEEANALIRAAVMNAGAPFDNLPEAVHLLEARGRKQEALAYAQAWSQAEPWNGEAKLTLAKLEGKAAALEAIRTSQQFPYDVRVGAAESLAELHHATPGNDELALLTHDQVSPEQAAQPFYVAARLRAAGRTVDSDRKRKLLSEVIALDPAVSAPRLLLAEAAFASERVHYGVAALESYRRDAPLMDSNAEWLETTLRAARLLIDLRNFSRAIELCDAIPKTDLKTTEHEKLRQLREEALTKQELETLNAERQPQIHSELMQSVVVRPKLAQLPAGVAEQ